MTGGQTVTPVTPSSRLKMVSDFKLSLSRWPRHGTPWLIFWMFLPWALNSATFSSPAGSRNAKSMGILLAPGADEAVAAFRKKFPEVRCLGRKHDENQCFMEHFPLFWGASQELTNNPCTYLFFRILYNTI